MCGRGAAHRPPRASCAGGPGAPGAAGPWEKWGDIEPSMTTIARIVPEATPTWASTTSPRCNGARRSRSYSRSRGGRRVHERGHRPSNRVTGRAGSATVVEAGRPRSGPDGPRSLLSVRTQVGLEGRPATGWPWLVCEVRGEARSPSSHFLPPTFTSTTGVRTWTG